MSISFQVRLHRRHDVASPRTACRSGCSDHKPLCDAFHMTNQSGVQHSDNSSASRSARAFAQYASAAQYTPRITSAPALRARQNPPSAL
eukprot:CAMPEP_0185840820 /NCGR_PEP_ID=MMETSP1353-20130828/16849_1 /TAXON_ID=1077150 /ORGANISM="Erythrolobus australicus, Strain CCMP3124" /LENGTH=88 /DNA_ID=CAMNT_0028540199 /DNA_START=157 /DNA_END=419 /DNA_ORIENTATION=-